MTADPFEAVKAGYARLAARYDDWAGQVTPESRLPYLDWLDERLAPGDTVVELGCGTGVPVAARLAARYTYIGVDGSAEMLAVARRRVPGADLRLADMREFEAGDAQVAAVVAFYSIIHVPRADHPALFAAVRRWLRPGGYFVANFGTDVNPAGTEEDWLGAGAMYWSGWDRDTCLRLVEEAGFDVLAGDVVVQHEPEGDAEFLFVTARAS